MRIAAIGPAHPLRGGLSTFNMILAREMQNEGHEVKIFTFSLQYPSLLFPGKSQFSDEPPPSDLEIDVCINSVNPLNWFISARKVIEWKPDVVVFRYWLPFMGPALGTIARLIRSKCHARLVAITDNVIPHEKRPGDKLFTKYFLSSCHGFVTMSKSVLKDLEPFLGNQPAQYHPHPLYNSFGPLIEREQALMKLGLSSDFRYVLFFGFIREYKGLDLLLEAWSDERLKRLPVKLIIAGEFYTNAQPYDELIDRFNLGDRIIRKHDFIPDSEVNLWFSASDMVAQTYKHATQSGVTQIAYFYGKPMLVTNVGGLAELVPHGKVGYVTDPDPKQIADALEDFFVHDHLDKFTEGVKLERLNFSWSSFIQQILHVVG